MTQSLPLTYADLVYDDDLDLFATETQSDLQNLIQDVTHVLRELMGSNPDDPKKGIGVETYLSGTIVQFQTLPGLIESQLSQDDRINQVSATANQNPDGTFSLTISIAVSGSVLSLQYAYSQVSGLILQAS